MTRRCGFIEWVNDTKPIKGVISDKLVQLGYEEDYLK